MTRRFSAPLWAILILLGAVSYCASAPPAEKAKTPVKSPAKRSPAFPATLDAVEKAKVPEKPPAPAQDEYFQSYKVLIDTIDQIERNYVKAIDRRELIEAAIKGAVGKLDPYSNYIGPKELSAFRAAVESEFGGIGIQISSEDGELKVVSPLYGTPAYRAGVQSGDSIVEIDGKSTDGIDQDEAVERLKGKEGTQVTLTLVHAGHPAGGPLKVKLTRERVRVDTVLGDRRKADDTWDFMLDAKQGVGYVRLSAFSRETAVRTEKGLARVARPAHAGIDPRPAVQPGRTVELGHRSEQSLHFQRSDRQHAGPQHAPARLGRPQGRGLRGLSHGRPRESLQRQRQRDRLRLPARPPSRGRHGRADLGQGERAERDRPGGRPQRA